MSDIDHQFLMALMNTVPDRIYFKDRQGRFLSCNQAFAEFLHLEDGNQLIGKTDFDIFLPDHAIAA